jgi:DNA-binding NarL/FixJ family response regulator
VGANLPLARLWKAALADALPHLGPHTLLLDHPTGLALRTLDGHAPHVRARTLVLTTSAVPEYLDDLWDAGIALLAVNVTDARTLRLLLNSLTRGDRVRWQAPPSPLTPAERRVLRLAAAGETSKRIAQQLALSDRTVQNTLSRIFERLHLAGRTEAALYYWGTPPPLLPETATPVP